MEDAKVRAARLDARAVATGEYIAETGATYLEAAEKFGYKPAMVCSDMLNRLPRANAELARKVADVIAASNKARCIQRGKRVREFYQARRDKD